MKYTLSGISKRTLKTSKVLKGMAAAVSLVVIGALALGPSFATAATIGVLEAETMSWNGSSSGSIVTGSSPSTTYLRLMATGAVATGTINSTGSTTSVVMKAKANICSGSPQLRLSVNNVVITTPTVTNESKFVDYTAPLSVGVGNHSVKLELLNYYKTSSCNRNAIIDSITLIGTVAPPPDTIAPTVSVTSPTVNAQVAGTTNVAATAADNVGVTKVEFYVNDIFASSDLTAPYEYAWDTTQTAEGPATVKAKAYDAAGLATTSALVTVTVDNIPPPDTTAPTVSITSPAADTEVSGTTEVVAVAWDNVAVTNVEFYLNGSLASSDSDAPYSYTWDTVQTADGPATLTAKAYDAAGLVTSSAPVVVTVENVPTPPIDPNGITVNITSPAAGAQVSGTTTVTADATDDLGVANVEFYLDDTLVSSDSEAPYEYIWDTLQTADGTATLLAKAYDTTGAVTSSTPVAVTVDNVPDPDTTAPTASVTSPVDAAVVTGTTTVAATAADNVGVTNVEFYLNDVLASSDAEAPYEYTWDTLQTAEGPVILTVKAYDAAGLVTTSSPVTVTVDNVPPPDTTAPTVGITSPAPNAVVTGTTNVVAVAWDNVAVTKVEFYLNGNLVATDLDAPYSYAWDTLQAAEGPATLTAKAYDTAGLTTTSTAVTVTVDNVPTPTPPPYPPTDITDLTDVPYGADPLQKMDIHPATNGQIGEAVIMIHGGVWSAGDKIGTVTTQSKNLAAKGFTVFNVNYRLASQTVVGYPKEVEDIEAVIKWVVAYGAQYKANVQGIDMVGGSSGGHLAMLASQRQNAITPGTISTIASLSGPTDFVAPWPKKIPQMDYFLGCDVYAKKCSTDLLKEASPNYNVKLSTCPAIYLMNNTNESIPQIQADNMYNTLVAAGCVTKKNIMTGTDHSFSYWSSVETSIVDWLNTH